MLALKNLFVAAVIGAAALPAVAQNLLINGNFELSDPAVPDGGFATVNAGANTIIGWTVGGTSVDLIQGNFGAISNVSVDLAGTPGPGSIEQSFSVIAGMTYLLNFQYSNNGGSTPVDVTFGGVFQSFSINTSLPASGMLAFTALTTGTQSVLFASSSTTNNGAVVDNISVTAVPEPTTYALALAAVALVGGLSRGRKV